MDGGGNNMSGQAAFRRAISSFLAILLGPLAVVGLLVAVTAAPAGAAAPIHGIDVSSWQGPVNWGAVRQSGRQFAFAKATEGATFVDSTFATNRQAMAGAGLALRGFYHFARPDRNSAAAEAAHFLRTVGPLGPGEVAVLDLEVAPSAGVSDWAAQWLALVARGTGRTPILYSYQSYLYSIPTSGLTQYPLWMAAWGTNDGNVPAESPKSDRWSRWTWWQYTSNSTVPGVTGHVDENLFAGTAAELAAYGGTTPPPTDPVGDLLRGLTDGLGALLGKPRQ